jgi:hypothetical protein
VQEGRRSRNLAVAERDDTGHDGTLAGPPQLAATVAFDDLGPLELGHRGLDLDHQPALRIVGRLTIAEDHRNAKAAEQLDISAAVRYRARPVNTIGVLACVHTT